MQDQLPQIGQLFQIIGMLTALGIMAVTTVGVLFAGRRYLAARMHHHKR